MNRQELALVVADLQRHLDRPFGALWQPSRDRVVLGLADGTLLLLVPRGPFARIHSVARRPKNPQRPYSFQGACRAHLGGRLLEIKHNDPEREVRFTFAHGALLLRLTGRSGGLWLMNEKGVISAFDGPAPDVLPALPPAPPRDPEPRFSPEDGKDWDRAARDHFMGVEGRQRTNDQRQLLERNLRRAIDRQKRLLVNLGNDLDKASKAALMRAKADLLSGHLHAIPRGVRTAEVLDWSSGEQVVLTLDPTKTAAAQMDSLYNKARRLDRMGDQVLERIDRAETTLASLAADLATAPDADRDLLRTISDRLPSSPSRRAHQALPDITTWTGPNGERVLAGRNAKSNRKLTFQVARGSDWWLHLRERPGAHVVVPTRRDQTPDLELLLAAAQVVLVAAKVPPGVSMDVQYTRIKDVRSIPGEVALVRVANEKVLHITREPAVLTGWSSSRD